MAFSKLKALLRKAAARTVEGLRTAIATLIGLVTPHEAASVFSAAGYEADPAATRSNMAPTSN